MKCSARFLGLFCRPWQNVRRRTTCQLEVSHQQRKSDRKYTEDFPFCGLWDAVFTAFGCNSSRDIFHTFLCSAQCSLSLSAADHARHLFWHMLLGNWRRTIYIAFKIWNLILLHLSLVKGWQLWGWCKLNGVWQGEMEMWGCTVNGVVWEGEMGVYSELCCFRGRN